MTPLVIGLNIKHTPIELLEQVSVHHSLNKRYLEDLMAAADLEGAVVLCTCNRLELYASTLSPEHSLETMREFLVTQGGGLSHSRREAVLAHVYSYCGDEALEHLFRVVVGLDSMVLGETEILGQAQRAYEAANAAGATDKLVNVWFQRALALGKKARSATLIQEYSTSVGRIAVDFAVQEFGDISKRPVLILGAGEMSELTMRHLVSRKASLVMVSNRSLSKAQKLAVEFGFSAHPLDDLESCLHAADIVFSATSARGHMISCELLARVMETRPDRPLLCVDMAVPRDIDPQAKRIAGVRCCDIKELREVADEHRHERELAAVRIEELIAEEMGSFKRWIDSLDLIPTINALRRLADEIKASKLERALGKLSGLSPQQRVVVQSMASSIVNQLLHEPISTLNALAGTPEVYDYARMLHHLFRLQPEAALTRAQAVLEATEQPGRP
ncbi:MAG: glutamyl-tRNA reductase [Coriobacteriales bacterium]|jgi:glutamyl-tRNA reductase|nr:glutamyl-tRNA reductase [Coriobacteriales bacterium]